MKINIDIDLTPEEARTMMGLPDLEPMHTALLEKVQAKIDENIEQMDDPEFLMKKFFPVGIQAIDQFQQFFSTIARTGTVSDKGKARDKEKDK